MLLSVLMCGAYLWYVKRHSIYPLTCSLMILMLGLLRIYQPQEPSYPRAEILAIKEVKTNYVLATCGQQDVVVYGLDYANYGDVYQITGTYERLDTIHNKGMFAFDEWMNRRGVFYAVQATSATLLDEGDSLRHQLYAHVQGIPDEVIRNFGKTMLFGIQDDEDASYMLTTSGMHISFLCMLLQKAIARHYSRRVASMAGILGIASISFITVLSSSLLRILCFQVVAFSFPRMDAKDRLGLSVIVVILIAPYMAWEMALLLPLLFRFAYIFQLQKRPGLLVSFMVVIPIQFYYFHSVQPLQIVLFPLLRYLYAFLYAMAWILMLIPWDVFMELLTILLDCSQAISSMGLVLYAASPLWWLCLWGYGVVQVLSYPQRIYILRLLTIFVLVFLHPYFDPFAHVTMLDVGQGDATLIELPYRKGVIMIDVMGSLYKNVPADTIVPYLHARGITEIDQLIITHQDYDHSGGVQELKELMPIHQLITTKDEAISDNDALQFLLCDYQGKDENENSVITYLQLYQQRFLFMGDAGVETEKELLRLYPRLEADVLKVGHHGSKTSSDIAFLHQLQPQLALISAGRNNRYGHPSQETLKRLEQEGIYPLVTAQQGSITIHISKYVSFFETADHHFGRLPN